MMKYRKIIAPTVIVTFLFSLLLVTFCGVVSATTDLEDTAVTFVNQLKEKQFDAATELFNEELLAALPAERLETAWENLIANVGEFKEVTGTQTTEVEGYQVVTVTCKFANAAINIRVSFDANTQMAGVRFVAVSEGVHGIYIAALLVTGLAIALGGGLLYWLSKRQWKILALMLITVAFSAIANLFIKQPILNWVTTSSEVSSQINSSWPLWLLLFVLFLSPIVEEAIKIVPIAEKHLRRMINRSSALWIGMALGIGFGIGEIWYLAWQFSFVPQYAGYPFYYFTGFIGERLIIVFLHGVMTSIAVTGFLRGIKGLAIGYIGAILLHTLTNVGALLYQIQVIDGNTTSILLLISVLTSFVIFEFLRRKTLKKEAPSETILHEREEQIQEIP